MPLSETFEVPQSRNEAILQNMLGANNVLSEPMSREEKLLTDILENGGGSSSGSGSGVLVADLVQNESTFRLSKTWKEIRDAAVAGSCIFLRMMVDNPDNFSIQFIPVEAVGNRSGVYMVFADEDVFSTDTPDGYPSRSGGDDEPVQY